MCVCVCVCCVVFELITLRYCATQRGGSYQDKEIKFVGPCGTTGGGKKCLQILMGNTRGKTSALRTMLRWEDNIKVGLRERNKMERSGLGFMCFGMCTSCEFS